MARKWIGTWAGGRVAEVKGPGGKPRPRWVLERRWAGRQHSVPLRVRDEEGALAAL